MKTKKERSGWRIVVFICTIFAIDLILGVMIAVLMYGEVVGYDNAGIDFTDQAQALTNANERIAFLEEKVADLKALSIAELETYTNHTARLEKRIKRIEGERNSINEELTDCIRARTMDRAEINSRTHRGREEDTYGLKREIRSLEGRLKAAQENLEEQRRRHAEELERRDDQERVRLARAREIGERREEWRAWRDGKIVAAAERRGLGPDVHGRSDRHRHGLEHHVDDPSGDPPDVIWRDAAGDSRVRLPFLRNGQLLLGHSSEEEPKANVVKPEPGRRWVHIVDTRTVGPAWEGAVIDTEKVWGTVEDVLPPPPPPPPPPIE